MSTPSSPIPVCFPPFASADSPPASATPALPQPSLFATALSLGFATTVAVWLVAYICRLPMIQAPPALTVALMLLTIIAGGFSAGRFSAAGLRAGIATGSLAGLLLALLVVSSIFADIRRTHPEYASTSTVALWFLGSLLLTSSLAALGAAAGKALRPTSAPPLNAKALLAWTLPAATLPLITAGGLVTAWGAGLAVPDWPNSFGYNMFLLPLSQMQYAENGNVYYEHAHRLMGSLVGFTSLALALYLSFADKRKWIISLAWIIGLCVLIQGALGGFRVLYATKYHNESLATTLAIIHGIFAQLVFALMATLAAACSRTWQSPTPPIRASSVQTDYAFSAALVLFMCAQLVLGALLRHLNLLVIVHITNSVFVTLLAITCGIRAWGLYPAAKPLQRAGLAVVIIVFLQLLLGIFALILRHPLALHPTTAHAISTTLHQANGALLLAASLTLLAWTLRLTRPPLPPDA